MADLCRSCDAPIRFATTVAGKSIPLDLDPVPDGNIVVTNPDSGQPIQVRYLKRDEDALDDAERYVSHFVTCPQAASWRKTKTSVR